MSVDHSNDFEVADLFEKIKEENNGTLDILVNNAGESEQHKSDKIVRPVLSEDPVGAEDLPPSRFADMDEAEFQLAFDRKFFGMLRKAHPRRREGSLQASQIKLRRCSTSLLFHRSLSGQILPGRCSQVFRR